MMQFKSIADLNAAIIGNLHRFSADVDLVVGVPRSGLLAASILALHANRPLADLDGFLAGRKLQSGRTRAPSGDGEPLSNAQRVLVLDDSIRSGKTLEA